jgi:mono/diheme cytochrome c family protein
MRATLVVLGSCLLSVLAACSEHPELSAASPVNRTTPEPWSDPVEYQDRPISRAAGEAYFSETGLGDPYAAGLPYPVFLALMSAYPRELGADWNEFRAKFGALPRDDAARDANALPVGFHLTIDPNTRVAFMMNNCELCHAERLRLPNGERFVPGLGNKRIRIHAYDAAIEKISEDAALTPDRLVALANEAASSRGLVWPVAFRRPIVLATLKNLRDRARLRGVEVEKLSHGSPGRVATIESFTMALGYAAGHALPMPDTPGWAKIPDVRNVRYRDTLSWDAVGTGAMPVLVVEADLAFGARPAWFDAHRHLGASLYVYLHDFERKLPFPGHIDESLTAEGRDLFIVNCAPCHGYYDGKGGLEYHETVVPLVKVGTDPARADAVTEAFVQAANAIPLASGVSRVRRTGGYVPPPLLDVWARGTFGHAGQWPSLRVVATPPAGRPRRFVVRPDATYDLEAVGVATRKADGSPLTTGEYVFDGDEPGLGVAGHPFLADLGPGATAVIEYLKTL